MVLATAAGPALAAIPEPPRLSIARRGIEILGRPAEVFSLTLENGQEGLHVDPAERVGAVLHNRLGAPLRPHFHGQTPPAGAETPLAPGARRVLDFPARPGSHWIHASGDLTRQGLLAAPLIVHGARLPHPELTVLLQDFCFRPAEEVLAAWGEDGMRQTFQPDACLANGHGLDAPDPVRVAPGQRLLLRLVNAAASSDFIVDTGPIRARLIAVDGNPVQPLPVRRFPLALGQRSDLVLDVPPEHGAWSVLAMRSGSHLRTGIILGTQRGRIRKISPLAEKPADGFDPAFDLQLAPLRAEAPAPVERRLALDLRTGGDGRRWRLAGADGEPLAVRRGEQVEATIRNETAERHALHLHGHHFRLVALNGMSLPGIARDTFVLPARGAATIAFRADRAGNWPLSGQNLYDGLSGLSTTLACLD